MKKKIGNILLKLIPLILFLGLWEFLIPQERVFFFSKPSLISKALFENLKNGILVSDFFVTGSETIIGFCFGSLLGLILGFGFWYSKRVGDVAKPYVIAIGAIPIFAIAPMTIIWFGTGFFAKVIMATLSTFIVALVQSFEGAQNVDKDQITLLKTFGANRWIVFTKVIIPSSAIWVLSSLKLNIGFALLGAFIGEFISAESGLGYRILKASGLYDTSLVLAGIFLMVCLALILNFGVSLIEKRIKFYKY